MRDALRDFAQKLRDAQRERVRQPPGGREEPPTQAVPVLGLAGPWGALGAVSRPSFVWWAKQP